MIVILPSEWIESSGVSKINVPPVIFNDIVILVSLKEHFKPFALSSSLLKFVLEAPLLYVFILKFPSLIINADFAWIPSLYELILNVPLLIVIIPSLTLSS